MIRGTGCSHTPHQYHTPPQTLQELVCHSNPNSSAVPFGMILIQLKGNCSIKGCLTFIPSHLGCVIAVCVAGKVFTCQGLAVPKPTKLGLKINKGFHFSSMNKVTSLRSKTWDKFGMGVHISKLQLKNWNSKLTIFLERAQLKWNKIGTSINRRPKRVKRKQINLSCCP